LRRNWGITITLFITMRVCEALAMGDRTITTLNFSLEKKLGNVFAKHSLCVIAQFFPEEKSVFSVGVFNNIGSPPTPLKKLSISHIFLNIKFDKKAKVCNELNCISRNRNFLSFIVS
jgi:hypothetical protein